MRHPENTERTAKQAPEILLADAMRHGTANIIEQQEADGQKSLINSETLPTEMKQYPTGDPKTTLEKWGVEFVGPVEDDPLFQFVRLPSGWKVAPTSHSLHSDLVDADGVARAAIFYKAAFYDRKATLTILDAHRCGTHDTR